MSIIRMIPPHGRETTTIVHGKIFNSSGQPIQIDDAYDAIALEQKYWRRFKDDLGQAASDEAQGETHEVSVLSESANNGPSADETCANAADVRRISDEPPAPRMSADRERLADLIEQREAIAAEWDALTAQIGRLEALQAAPGPISAEIAALDAAETEAVNQWSVDGVGDPPVPDAAKREALNRQLQDARAAAAAAQRAHGAADAKRNAVAVRQGAFAQPISLAAAEIAFDEYASPLLAELASADGAIKKARRKIDIARNFLMGAADRAGAAGQPLYRLLESFDSKLGQLSSPLPDESKPGMNIFSWLALAERLAADPTATLTG